MAESDELSVAISKVIILIEDHSGISFVCEKDKHVRVGPACVCKVKISKPSLHETQNKRSLFMLVMVADRTWCRHHITSMIKLF